MHRVDQALVPAQEVGIDEGIHLRPALGVAQLGQLLELERVGGIADRDHLEALAVHLLLDLLHLVVGRDAAAPRVHHDPVEEELPVEVMDPAGKLPGGPVPQRAAIGVFQPPQAVPVAVVRGRLAIDLPGHQDRRGGEVRLDRLPDRHVLAEEVVVVAHFPPQPHPRDGFAAAVHQRLGIDALAIGAPDPQHLAIELVPRQGPLEVGNDAMLDELVERGRVVAVAEGKAGMLRGTIADGFPCFTIGRIALVRRRRSMPKIDDVVAPQRMMFVERGAGDTGQQLLGDPVPLEDGLQPLVHHQHVETPTSLIDRVFLPVRTWHHDAVAALPLHPPRSLVPGLAQLAVGRLQLAGEELRLLDGLLEVGPELVPPRGEGGEIHARPLVGEQGAAQRHEQEDGQRLARRDPRAVNQRRRPPHFPEPHLLESVKLPPQQHLRRHHRVLEIHLPHLQRKRQPIRHPRRPEQRHPQSPKGTSHGGEGGHGMRESWTADLR